jgi:hypothetical protein
MCPSEIRAEVWTHKTSITPPLEMSTRPGKVSIHQNINNSECFGVKFVKIYPEMTSQ